MTRRIATVLNHPNITDISEWGVDNNGNAMLLITYDTGLGEDVYPNYQIGDEVAVAQAYSSVFDELEANVSLQEARPILEQSESAGWDNKMFVKASLMPYRIRITNIKVERLQDISEDDCIKEGLQWSHKASSHYVIDNTRIGSKQWFGPDARKAYGKLIDRISGKGTWERNPWVFAYNFELIK